MDATPFPDVGTRQNPARRRFALTLVLILIGSLVVVLPSFAGHTSDPGISGTFESADGDLDLDDGDFEADWNNLVHGLVSDGSVDEDDLTQKGEDLDYKVVFDAHNSNQDIVYQGGKNDAKHDVECPGLRTKKEQNKSDFTRFGIANETVDGDVFVYLYWIRGPQNSTSASGHASFELNQGETTCTGSSNDADVAAAEQQNVERTAGDVLFIYDFEGGQGQIPTITLHRWIDVTGDDGENQGLGASDCEVASSLPCWGQGSADLVTDHIADARVNDASIGAVADDISGGELGTVEFGEAGINFTDAGIFPAELTDPETDCVNFGLARVSSRSSGNSFNADLKDWVEPAEVTVSNCGNLTVKKETDPSGDTTTDFGFDFNQQETTFTLKDGDSKQFLVFEGTQTVTEDDPGPEYELDDIVCVATNNGSDVDYTVDLDARSVDVLVRADQNITCTFTNKLRLGSLVIEKVDDADEPMEDIEFKFENVADSSDQTTATTDADGIACVDGLLLGATYEVSEQNVPDDYEAAAETTLTVTDTDTCGDRKKDSADAEHTFENVRLHKIMVIACHLADDTLHPSDLTLDLGETTATATSLTLNDLDGGLGDEDSSDLETFLCGLDSGFEGLGHNTFDLEVDTDTHE